MTELSHAESFVTCPHQRPKGSRTIFEIPTLSEGRDFLDGSNRRAPVLGARLLRLGFLLGTYNVHICDKSHIAIAPTSANRELRQGLCPYEASEVHEKRSSWIDALEEFGPERRAGNTNVKSRTERYVGLRNIVNELQLERPGALYEYFVSKLSDRCRADGDQHWLTSA